MPPPKTKAKPAVDLPWRQRVPRRDWLVFSFVELIAIALLVTGIMRGDLFGLAAGLLMGLIYAPLRAGGWKLLRPWFSRTKPDRRDEAFYRRRK